MSAPDDAAGPTAATEATEARLRSALAQRAAGVEPADDALDHILTAGAGARRSRRRSAGLLAAAAVLVAVAVAVGASRSGPESVDVTDDPAPTTTTTTTEPDVGPETSGPTPTTTTAPEPTTVPGTSTTTPPPTTAVPPTTSAPSPGLPGGSTETASGPGTNTAVALIADVRVGASDGVERIVVEFLDGHLPDWSVTYVDPPIAQDGSGEAVPVAGEAFLLVTLTPASAFDLSGEVPRPTYPGPDRVPGTGGEVVEVVRVGDFEAVATWAVGLRSRAPFRVTTLTAPARLVIDVAAEG